MLIVEYCRFGNMHDFLHKHRDFFINQANAETDSIDRGITITGPSTSAKAGSYQNLPRIVKNNGNTSAASSSTTPTTPDRSVKGK